MTINNLAGYELIIDIDAGSGEIAMGYMDGVRSYILIDTDIEVANRVIHVIDDAIFST